MFPQRLQCPGYVRFVFEQVFGLNPDGRLGIEDFIIRSEPAREPVRAGTLGVWQ